MKARQEFASALLAAGKAALPLMVPGAKSALDLGEKIVDLIDKASGVIEHIPAELAETRDELERRVNAHVTEVADRLRGDG